MKISRKMKQWILLGAVSVLSACGGSDSITDRIASCSDCAVVTSVATDFGSSGVDFVRTTLPYSTDLNFAEQDVSDVRFTTFGDHFYRLGRLGQDNVSKWSFDSTSAPIWEFSLGSGANAYDMIFVSESKAYILRWGADEIWIVDPSVDSSATISDFKIGEIDLSAYNQGNASNTAAAVLDNGYLYVVLEGLDASFDPQTSYLIKIDTMTDMEVDVNGAVTGVDGYALTVKNASDLEILGTDIYVAGKGEYAAFDGSSPAVLSGGIERVDILGATFTSSVIVDDDNINVGAQITEIEIASATKGYLTRYNGWQNIDVIGFNPSTGDVNAVILGGYGNSDIRFIERDENNQLWIGVGSATTPRVDILSTVDDSLEGSANLEKNPTFIKFADTTN